MPKAIYVAIFLALLLAAMIGSGFLF